MADEEQEESGGAAEAFERLSATIEQMRGEQALMRRAIEGLAAERASIDVPDYSETLGHIAQGLDGINGRIDQIVGAIVKSPALAMTPAQISAQIGRAATEVRSADHAALATATNEMKQQARELHGVVRSARAAEKQRDRELWFGLGGFLIGVLLWTFLPGMVAREIAPASWRWPERMAAGMLDMPMWEAGSHLMATDSPASWNGLVSSSRIMSANSETIERCQKAANRAGEPVRCTIRIGAASGSVEAGRKQDQ
ncbi:DUF6118 family protein [Novosphingobium sp. EMRT-2]|uniref:DUF6118 family protein n=1 Tax=Novosphingobium sp. EMRT-2 TaxID=2571749 RepID=UPI0010BD4133|nr:DUF6118 family protein [Novosphingobium sp. EMRT-2]QCI96235.1 hypothetical protein FA702_21395 [Novosphingobium sp. EMRT-2]